MANWNRQGGSNRDNISKDSSRSQKKKTQANNAIDKLKASKSVSFKLVLQKDPTEDYGEFGDDINWIMDDLTDLEIDEDLSIPTNYNLVNPTRPITDDTRSESDDYRINASTNITPYNIADQYEIVVKYATNNLVLTIMSGQAYMARFDVNNARFDYALVVTSAVDLTFGTGSPSKVNAIVMGGNTSFKIIDSLYQWVRTKLAITSDSTGKSSDANLSAITAKTAAQLPDTKFTYQGIEHLLFGSGEGLKPIQICLSAIDKLLTFRSRTSYPATTYDVLWIGQRLALCAQLGGDNPPDPNPTVEYRFIAVFVDGGQFNIGGYDAADAIEQVLAVASSQNNRIGFNIIDPAAVNWRGIKPRSSPNPPAYTGMYWRLSYLEKDFQLNTRLRVLQANGVVNSSIVIDRADSFVFKWVGSDLWQSSISIANRTISQPISATNPSFVLFNPRDDLFSYSTTGLDRTADFITPFITSSDGLDRSLVRKELIGTNIVESVYLARFVDPKINTSVDSGDVNANGSTTIKQLDDIAIDDGSNATILRSIVAFDRVVTFTNSNIYGRPYISDVTTQSTETEYNSVDCTLSGQVKILKIQSKLLSPIFTAYSSLSSEPGQFNSVQFPLSRSSTNPQVTSNYPVRIDYKIGDNSINLCILNLDSIVDNSLAANGVIDVALLNWNLAHKYLQSITVVQSTVDEGDGDTGQETHTIARDLYYEIAKTPAYEYIESAYFVLVSTTEIKNCQITSVVDFEQAATATIVDPTMYCNSELMPEAEISNYFIPRTPQNSESLFSGTFTYTYTGFDASDPANNPYNRARKIKKIAYRVLNTSQHNYSGIVATNKLSMIFPSETYFDPTNSIITKPTTSESGLIARIYKSYRTATKKAVVEKWAVHNSGWIELANIEENKLGEYAPVTRNIYYYPGQL